jgi:hypothetical protein
VGCMWLGSLRSGNRHLAGANLTKERRPDPHRKWARGMHVDWVTRVDEGIMSFGFDFLIEIQFYNCYSSCPSSFPNEPTFHERPDPLSL